MTNTGDFRRYSYGSDTSYAIKAFSYERSSAAPSYMPEPKKEFKVRQNKANSKKSTKQLVHEQRLSVKKALQILLVAGLCLGMLATSLYSYAKAYELNNEISQIEKNLTIAQSENTRLNSELDSLVSVSMIDQYAVEKLGMSKMKSNQIKYIDVSQYKSKRLAAAQAVLKQKEAKSKAQKSDYQKK